MIQVNLNALAASRKTISVALQLPTVAQAIIKFVQLNSVSKHAALLAQVVL